MAQNAETSFRFERAQSTKWPQLARNRGDPEAIKTDIRTLNRERPARCAGDQLTGFAERKKGYEQKKQSRPACPDRGKGGRRNRSRSRRRDSKDHYGRAQRPDRVGTYRRPERRKKEKERKNTRTKKRTKKRKLASEPNVLLLFSPSLAILSLLREIEARRSGEQKERSAGPFAVSRPSSLSLFSA